MKVLAIFHECSSEDQKKRSSVQKCPQIFEAILRFSTNSKVKTKKKKKKRRSSFPKFHEIRCESTKTTKQQFLLANFRAISTNLGVLGLSICIPVAPKLLISSGYSPCLVGHQQSFGGGGGHGPGKPPRGAGPGLV